MSKLKKRKKYHKSANDPSLIGEHERKERNKIHGARSRKNFRLRKAKYSELDNAIATVEQRLGKSFMEHTVTRAFDSDSVLLGVLKKLVPDLKQANFEVALNGQLDFSYLSDGELDSELSLLIREFRNKK